MSYTSVYFLLITILLLVQLAKSANGAGFCDGNHCNVTPDNMRYLQDMMQSNKVLEFEKGNYHITSSSIGGFIQVQHIANLTIIGQGAQSLIMCSPNTTFGIYFNNTFNITISGLSISNCSVAIPKPLTNVLLYNLYSERECSHLTHTPDNYTTLLSSFLVVDSNNVTFSDVAIRSSPGFALIAIDTYMQKLTSTYEVFPFSSRVSSTRNILIEDSEMSLNKQGSLLLYRIFATLSQNVYTNNTNSLLSIASKLNIRSMYLLHSPMILIRNEQVLMSENVSLNQSLTCMQRSNFSVENGNMTISNNIINKSKFAVAVLDSTLEITFNTLVVFVKNHLALNASAFLAIQSYISIQQNSKLIFMNNTANSISTIFSTQKCLIFINKNASLTFKQNFVTSTGWIFLARKSSRWQMCSNSSVVFQDNRAEDAGVIMALNNSNFSSHGNSHIVFSNNVIKRNSAALFFFNSEVFVERSVLLLTKNNCSSSSFILYLISSTAIFQSNTSLLSHKDVVETTFESLVVFKKNHVSSIASAFFAVQSYITIQSNAKVIFMNNTANSVATLFGTQASYVTIKENSSLVLEKNFVTSSGWVIQARSSSNWNLSHNVNLIFHDNKAQDVGIISELHNSYFNSYGNSKIEFSNNTVENASTGLFFFNSTVHVHKSILLLAKNNCSNSSVLTFELCVTTFQNNAFLRIMQNNVLGGYALLFYVGRWIMDLTSLFHITKNTAKKSYSIAFIEGIVDLSGKTYIQENTATNVGVMNAFSSQVFFQGKLECLQNKAESGIIYGGNTNLYITGDALFLENTAVSGGAVFLYTSTMYISPNSAVNFTLNHASEFGGAVFIINPRYNFACAAFYVAFSCTIQVYLQNNEDSSHCTYFHMLFNQNTAGIAGNAIYGDRTSACIPAKVNAYCIDCPRLYFSTIMEYVGNESIHNLSNFTSDPTRVCFCESGIPQCYFPQKDISVHPGEVFNLSLATIGYGFGTVPGSVLARIRRQSSEQDLKDASLGSPLQQSQKVGIECSNVSYSIISREKYVELALAVNTNSFTQSPSQVKTVVDFQLTRNATDVGQLYMASPYNLLYEAFFNIPVFVHVNLVSCPIGFQLLNGHCTCAQILINNGIKSCKIIHGSAFITRPSTYWIGLPSESVPGIVVHSPCPYDYCTPHTLNITPQTPDQQCQFHRSGTLCGGCENGFSTILGSSECRKCSDLFLTLILAFAMAGLVLVAFLSVLNLTVSVGTINGLIFYANIVQAINTAFEPISYTNSSIVVFLRAFIAWVNLDLGIPTCFYDGMDAYTKTWLQFIFPFYILVIVTAIIITSHYFTWAVKLFGNNSVPVLATLILLSYTKMLRVLITAISFTILHYEGNNTKAVWLFDGNVNYFELKHALLFMVALLVLIVAIPYVAVITLAPWIQKSMNTRISFMYNKCKPLFDAYMGPYKDKHRYWTGLLLLIRVALIIMFSSNVNTNALESASSNLLIVCLFMTCLLVATATFKPYKRNRNNKIETFFLLNLVILSLSSLYISGLSTQVYAYSFLVGVAFLEFVLVVAYHSYLKMRMKLFHKTQPQALSTQQADINVKEVEEDENNTYSTEESSSLREPLMDFSSI